MEKNEVVEKLEALRTACGSVTAAAAVGNSLAVPQ